MNNFKGKKIAIFHHLFLGHLKGGGEKLILQMKDHLQADLFIGSFDPMSWGGEVIETNDGYIELKYSSNKDQLDGFAKQIPSQGAEQKDDFSKQLWNGKGRVAYLHTESNLPIWKYVKRQLNFLFSPKINLLANYDMVIFSFGNIAFVPQRLKKINPKIKTLAYIHTPPRGFAEQFEEKLNQKVPKIFHPIARLFQKQVIDQFRKALQSIDYTITNSQNIRNRVKKYVGLETNQVIWPATETENLQFEGQSDFYLSHARLESAKRIELIIQAFAKMDKKLIITSSGPLKGWVEEQIKDLDNITYEGRVSDERRDWLMRNCIAGIYIPVDEDAGITQCEFMTAGKPVIGVQEGGLLETVIDGQTGILIPANPKVEDLIEAVKKMTPELALSMKDASALQAKKFGKDKFFEQLDEVIDRVSKS